MAASVAPAAQTQVYFGDGCWFENELWSASEVADSTGVSPLVASASGSGTYAFISPAAPRLTLKATLPEGWAFRAGTNQWIALQWDSKILNQLQLPRASRYRLESYSFKQKNRFDDGRWTGNPLVVSNASFKTAVNFADVMPCLHWLRYDLEFSPNRPGYEYYFSSTLRQKNIVYTNDVAIGEMPDASAWTAYPHHDFLGLSTDPDATAPQFQFGETVDSSSGAWPGKTFGAKTLGDTNGVVVLYAVWKPHVVEFDLDPGAENAVLASNTVWMTGTDVCPPLPEPVRPGWFFQGWYDGDTELYEGRVCGYEDGETVKLAAKWRENKFNVALVRGNYAVFGDESVDARNGFPMPPAAMPAREGYDFGGYFDGDGNKYYNADGSSAKDWDRSEHTYLYAKWTAKSVELILDDNGGSGGAGKTVATYGEAIPSVRKPSRAGYVFDGYWTFTAGGEQAIGADGKGRGDWNGAAPRTLYAHWKPVEYSVHYDFGGGKSGTTNLQTSAVFGLAFPVGVPARTGYLFDGFEFSGEYDAGTAVVDAGSSAEYVYFKNLCSVSGGAVNIAAKWKTDENAQGKNVVLKWFTKLSMGEDQEDEWCEGENGKGVSWTKNGDGSFSVAVSQANTGISYLAGSVEGTGVLKFEWKLDVTEEPFTPYDYSVSTEGPAFEIFSNTNKFSKLDEWETVSNVVESTGSTEFKWWADALKGDDDMSRKYTVSIRNVKWFPADEPTPVPVYETLPSLSAVAIPCTGEYDGEPHRIEVLVDPAVENTATNLTVLYSMSEKGEYSSKEPVPQVSATGEPATVWYSVTADGYAGLTNSCTISIAKAKNAWLAGPVCGGWYSDTGSSPGESAKAGFGEYAVTYSTDGGEPPTEPGVYEATFKVAETADYEGLETNVVFTVAKSVPSYTVRFYSNIETEDGAEEETFEESHGYFDVWEMPECPFEYDMHVFAGWSMCEASTPENAPYKPGDKVWSLSKADGGEVSLNAIWKPLVYDVVAKAAPESSAKGKVSVSSATVEPGGKATLTAKASNSSTLFAYWLDEEGNIVSYKPTAVVSPGAASSYSAVFRLKSKCAKPKFDSTVWGADGFQSANSMAGVAYRAQVSVNRAAYPVKFTAKNLPKGLKIDATTGVISGVPSKTGTFTATITATSKASSKKKVSKKVKISVAALPAWARGTFTGAILGDGESGAEGSAAISITTAGKFSGSFVSGGTNWTVSTTGYAATSVATAGVFRAAGNATRTVGKTAYKLHWTFEPERNRADGSAGWPAGEQTAASGELGDGREISLQRYFWKDSAALPYLPSAGMPGLYSALFEDGSKISLSLDKYGAVKATRVFDVYDSIAKKNLSKSRAVSTKLLYDDGSHLAFVYFPKTTATVKNKKNKVTSKIAYPEFIAGGIVFDASLRPEDGGEEAVAYRLPGVVPAVDPGGTGSGSFKYSTSYGQTEPGGTVTVTAVPAKGSVFKYWVKTSLVEDLETGETVEVRTIVSRSAKYKVAVGEEDVRDLTAVFNKKKK